MHYFTTLKVRICHEAIYKNHVLGESGHNITNRLHNGFFSKKEVAFKALY
jgi:hypothetical protein